MSSGDKLLKYWPVAAGVVAVVGALYITSHDVGKHTESISKLWVKTSDNKDQIGEMKAQAKVIEYRLNSVDEKLMEQKTDIKEILQHVKR